jgi:hypothetical protein
MVTDKRDVVDILRLVRGSRPSSVGSVGWFSVTQLVGPDANSAFASLPRCIASVAFRLLFCFFGGRPFGCTLGFSLCGIRQLYCSSIVLGFLLNLGFPLQAISLSTLPRIGCLCISPFSAFCDHCRIVMLGCLLHSFDKLLLGGSRGVAALDKVHFLQGRHPVGNVGFKADSNFRSVPSASTCCLSMMPA